MVNCNIEGAGQGIKYYSSLCPNPLTIGEVKAVGRLGGPQTHGIDSGVLVAGYGIVISHGHHNLRVLPAVHLRRAKEMDGNVVLGAREFPTVAKAQPVIRYLHLHPHQVTISALIGRGDIVPALQM